MAGTTQSVRSKRRTRAAEIKRKHPDGIYVDGILKRVRVSRRSGFLIGITNADQDLRIDPFLINDGKVVSKGNKPLKISTMSAEQLVGEYPDSSGGRKKRLFGKLQELILENNQVAVDFAREQGWNTRIAA